MLFTIYILIVLLVGMINWGILFPPPQRELIDTTSIESWVPLYVLYDPPGNLSYGECYGNYSMVIIRLDGTSHSIVIDSEFTTHMGFSSFSTLISGRGHAINALYLNQTWQLWKYSDGTRDWLQAEMANFSHSGDGIFNFDSASYINRRGMMVENKTGEESPYFLEWTIPAGETEEITLEWIQKDFIPLGSYMVHIFGRDILIDVSISITTPVTNFYVFDNNMTSLSTRLFCNGPIERIEDGYYRAEGVFVWFDR